MLTANPSDSYDPTCACIRWSNPAAWSAAPPFTLGNAPHADPRARTPGRRNWDVAFQKSVPIAHARPTIRAEVLNALDDPFFGPRIRFGAQNFGEFFRDGGFPRTLQIDGQACLVDHLDRHSRTAERPSDPRRRISPVPTMSDGVERWRRLEEVCQAALERPTDERAAFLAQACGADEDLRHEAASLLARDARAHGFLETPLGELAANTITYSPGGTPRPDELRDFIGRRIGTYEIRARLGAGGMGEVYRAHDHTLGRDVAIKVLPAAFSADSERLARFEREARLLASLSHPHIGAIYGLEGSGDVRALVLELIDGETLEARLRRGPFSISHALTLAVQIAEALDHAHRQGVTHRDLKPANIMLTKAGAKLLDFGLAKWRRGPSGYVNLSAPTMKPEGVDSLTEEGTILGTPHYMAPEQLEGKEMDARADAFAFGAVLYEMLTGRKAFDGGSAAAVMAAVLTSEPAPLAAIQPPVPRSLERLIQKCLAKDPD